MKALLTGPFLTVASLATLLTTTLAAQWPNFVRADVPRTSSGQPDLNAPTRRLANGKPDLSGVWESRIPPGGRLGGPALPSIGEVVHTKDEVVILYEANAGQRQILTDGRTLPSVDANPFWDGYSVGRWDGDTLVVESMGYRDDGWLDVNGSPLGNTTIEFVCNENQRFRSATPTVLR